MLHRQQVKLLLEPQPLLELVPPESLIVHHQLVVQPQRFEQQRHLLVLLPQQQVILEQQLEFRQFELRLDRLGHLLRGLEHQHQHQHFGFLAQFK